MLAVALFAVPGAYQDLAIVQFLRHHFNDSTRPYVLITSQWQSWPLFAPDPLRRVTRMHVETRHPNTGWEPIAGLDDGSIAWWRYAKEVKMIERLFENGRTKLRERYLELECKRAGITEETPVRSRYRYFIIPKHEIQATAEWWKNWEPEWYEETDIIVVCNHKDV